MEKVFITISIVHWGGAVKCLEKGSIKYSVDISIQRVWYLQMPNSTFSNNNIDNIIYIYKQSQFNVSFNDKEIEQVGRNKYLGNIIRRIDKPTQDIFADHNKYLADQARKAMFCAKGKIKDIGVLPPHIMFYIFDTIVTPITTYGSDVWRCNLDLHYTEKVFLDFIKCVLRVKATTCTTIVYGECERLPRLPLPYKCPLLCL